MKNLQGDVVGILSNSGTLLARYTYNPWGKLTSVKNASGVTITDASNIALRNPFRYRSYMYDDETGFYYVSSRYYDPEIGRWINADSVIAGVGGSIQGYNRREIMRKAIKYIYDANPFYVHWKKHFCPKCGNKLELRYISKIVNSNSPEAKDYDSSVGDTFFVGDVEFRTRYFHCANCQLDISFREMKKYEKSK